jgi:hypothetical protein
VWVTELRARNPTPVPADITATFTGSGPDASWTRHLKPYESIVVPDVLGRLFGLTEAVGTLQIDSAVPILIEGRTLNTGGRGTYGAANPVFTEDGLLAPPDVAVVPWLSHEPSLTAGERTNVGLACVDVAGCDVEVRLHDGRGGFLGATRVRFDRAGFTQLSAGQITPGSLPLGRVEVAVTLGKVAGFVSVVDNITGDGSVFALASPRPGPTDALLAGAARSPGRSGSYWITGVRIYNPSAGTATLTAFFNQAGQADPSPKAKTLDVAPAATLEIADVLGTLFDAPAGSAGAIRFRADSPLAVLGRTRNVDPLGVTPGAFGSSQRAVSPDDLLTAGRTGSLLGVSQNASCRTNVGLAAGPQGASFTARLRSAAGVVTAVATDQLGENGWRQPAVTDLFAGADINDESVLEITVGSGSLAAFVSVIDQTSNDPTATEMRRVEISASPVITAAAPDGPPIEPFVSDGDLWMSTWAGDGALYCGWGDGKGVGSRFTDCGIARFTGPLPDIRAEARCIDAPTAVPAVNDKPSSLLAMGGRLYGAFHSPLGDAWIGYLATSEDGGATWQRVGFYQEKETPPQNASPWTRDRGSPFRCLFLVNRGQDHTLDRDGWVYALGIGQEWGWSGGVTLARVREADLLRYAAWEYLSGLEDGIPAWSAAQEGALPLPGLFAQEQGSAMYHAGLGRYLFLTARALFDAPHPWGPWTLAGSWGDDTGPVEWQGGYQPGIVSKDAGPDSFWFTLAGQSFSPQIDYRLHLGRMVVTRRQ